MGGEQRSPTCYLNLKYGRSPCTSGISMRGEPQKEKGSGTLRNWPVCNLARGVCVHRAQDLREPLRAISLYTERLVQKTQMDANAKEMATRKRYFRRKVPRSMPVRSIQAGQTGGAAQAGQTDECLGSPSSRLAAAIVLHDFVMLAVDPLAILTLIGKQRRLLLLAHGGYIDVVGGM